MALARVPSFVIAAAYLGMSGCATGPAGDRARVIEIPLASVHSNIAFTMTTGSRRNLSCAETAACPPEPENGPALRFALQVQRVAGVLQAGVEELYPDLAQRVPGLTDSRFDVYVVEGEDAASDSSASGRIALNAALGTWQPYDDWVAFVIAREMGHVIARHHEENSAARIATSVILNLILPGSGLLKSVLSAGGSGIAAISKRDVQSIEADTIALNLLKASGFRLRDVSLSLLVAPVSLDEGSWAQRLRISSDNLRAEVRNSEFAIATVALAASDRSSFVEPALP